MTNRGATARPSRTDAAPRLSPAAWSACAAFGLVPRPAPPAERPIPPSPAAAHAAARPGVVLLTGPSGSGKSRRLAGLALAAPRRRVLDARPPRTTRAVFDAVGADAHTTARCLAGAGLAEPALWARPAPVLSAGERARLGLACAFAHARPGDLIVCDEFASVLDRATAQALGATASAWARRAGVTLLAATAHEDAALFLDTTAVIDARTGAVRPGRPRTPPAVRIEPATRADLAALARHHYRPVHPGPVVRILRAVRTPPAGPERVAGVLVAAMPTLNASWREQAWPGRYAGPRTDAARRLNAEVRRIARVIVEPDSRGLGVATALVRAYLADPDTPATEAVAAMGAWRPFFRNAGMTEYRTPRPAHDARLADALEHLGLTPADLARAGPRPPMLDAELARWAAHAKVRPPRAASQPEASEAIALHAACRLLTEPRAYAHTRETQP